MKNRTLLLIFVIFSLIIFLCNSTLAQSRKEYKKILAVPKPIITNAVWVNIDKDKVYNNCITSLHLQDYEIEPLMTSKESGLIVTKPVNFYPPFWRTNILGGEYYLNILVYNSDSNNVLIDIQIKGIKIYDYKSDAAGNSIRIVVEKGTKKHYGTFEQFEVFNGLTIKISEDVEQFLIKLETIQGKAISKTTKIISWE